MRRKAFTLVESLVVIAIIALLLPVFSRTRAAQRAQDLSCVVKPTTGPILYQGDEVARTAHGKSIPRRLPEGLIEAIESSPLPPDQKARESVRVRAATSLRSER